MNQFLFILKWHSIKRIQLVNHCPADLRGNLDKDIAAFVLSSVINNALKFTKKKGKITISSKKINSCILFKIDDTGIGVPKDILKNLYKLSKINSKKGTANELGTGLGLILCQELIRIHGGVMRIKSVVGKGTTVLAIFK